MHDSSPGSDPFRPMSPRAVRWYLAVLAASAMAIVLSVLFGWDLLSPAPSGDSARRWVFIGIFLGVLGLCRVIGDLLRHVAILGREVGRLKAQSSQKPTEATLTWAPGDALPARVARILQAYETQLYLAPSIPPKKLANARAKACVPADEKVLGLIDCTVFGSASACLVFGSRGFYYSDGGDTNRGGAGQTILAQDRQAQTAGVRTALDRLGKLGPKIARFQSKLEGMYAYQPGSVAYSEFSRCQFTTSGLFCIRLDKDRYCNQSGSRVSRGKIIAILTAIQQAVIELAGQGAEAGGGLSA